MLCDWGISLKNFFNIAGIRVQFRTWNFQCTKQEWYALYHDVPSSLVAHLMFMFGTQLFSNVNQNNVFHSIGTTLWIRNFLFVYNSCFGFFTNAISTKKNYKDIKQTNLISGAWLQASTALHMRSAVFWDITQRRAVISWPLNMEPIGRTETSVRNYHSYLLTYLLTYWLTYLLIPWSRVLLEKLKVLI